MTCLRYFLSSARKPCPANNVSGQPYGAVPEPSNIEAVITPFPTGSAGAPQLWKLNHYYEPGDLTDVFLLASRF